MKKIGIVICNYNKSACIINCIQSVLESTTTDYDIYVVDNASTDDSVMQIESHFGSLVTILKNTVNMGGSGGFNTGIRKVLELKYPYLLCLDNDVLVDENAILHLYEFLVSHQDVGSVGARVYHMESPDYIQQSGINIDMAHFSAETLYADTLDDGSIPEIVYCDTVATCCAMIRTSILHTTDIGIMPQDNFIYWDDCEWGYRITQTGYRVAVYGAAQVLHAMGARDSMKYAFTNYYIWRNRIHFFLKYTPAVQLESMSLCLLREIFDVLYECLYREEHNLMRTIHFAFTDALFNIRGMADPDHLLDEKQNTNDEKLYALLSGKNSFYVNALGYDAEADYFVNHVLKRFPDIKRAESKETSDISFTFCDYIMNVSDFSFDTIYIDTAFSILSSPDDVTTIRNYTYSKSLFIYMNQAAVLDTAHKIQSLNSNLGSDTK